MQMLQENIPFWLAEKSLVRNTKAFRPDILCSARERRSDQIINKVLRMSHLFLIVLLKKNTLAFWKNLHFKSSAAVGLQ